MRNHVSGAEPSSLPTQSIHNKNGKSGIEEQGKLNQKDKEKYNVRIFKDLDRRTQSCSATDAPVSSLPLRALA